MYKNSLVINIPHGIHTRIAAMIVHKASELKAKYNINLYIRKSNSKDPLAISMLALVSLKVKEGEIIEISSLEDTVEGRNAVLELSKFIAIDLAESKGTMSKIDAIIEENTIANEQIIESIPMGIVVIDVNSYITTVNEYALNLIDKDLKDVIGRNVIDVIPTSDLPKVINSKQNHTGKIQNINKHITVVNRSPIYSNGKIIGAIGVFQDISELVGIKELDENFRKTLETSEALSGNFDGKLSVSKAVSEIKELMEKLEKSEVELNYYKDELKRQDRLSSSFNQIIGSSSSLKEVLILAEKSAHSPSTVLIRGESGTGKELIAKAIHYDSDRKDKAFVRVNCAAIPENLFESELFGYEKGAFTGAVKNKPGKFNLANEGTIFLDEIGDMPKSMQVKLLRVLQEKEFESVGGLITQKVNVRVIAATNRNLEDMISKGEFREDLYYRLNVITLNLPPLRERKEDIYLLVEHFINKISKVLNKKIMSIDSDCNEYLQSYSWPGNIRELENIIERAINICDNGILTSKDFPFYITNIIPKSEKLINFRNDEILPLEEYEKEIIALAMKKYKSYNKAAKALGLTHRTVGLKCKKYGIEV